jgi:hypothetical protein
VKKKSTMPNAESVRKFQLRVVPTLGSKEKHHANAERVRKFKPRVVPSLGLEFGHLK